MNGKINYKLSDDALEQVVGGAQNMNGNQSGETLAKCPNLKCKSHDTNYIGYNNDKAVFKLNSGGRAYCTVCHTEKDM